jgi:hypothetical protein
MTPLRVRRGMTLEDAMRSCRELGGAVEEGHHGGEIRFSHPLMTERRVVHSQRDDAPITLVAWLSSITRKLTALRDWCAEEECEAMR